MLHPDPKVRERARFEQGLLDYIDSQRPSQPRERRDAHIVEHHGDGVSKTTNVNTGAVTVNGIPVSRTGPQEAQLIAALQDQRRKADRAAAPAPALPQPPTAGEVARNTTLHRDPDGGGKIVQKLPDGTTRTTDLRTRKVTVDDPRDHFVGNVLDEARETVTEGLMAIPSAIGDLAQASHDASVLDGTSPYSSDDKERRAAQERMKQRGDNIAHAVQNPGEVLENLARPYLDDLNSDKPERAIGRAAVDIGSMFATGGASAVIKGIKAAEAVTGGRKPDSNSGAADSPQKPDPAPPQPGSGGPAPGSSPGEVPGSPDSPGNAPGQQNPTDRPAPPAASAPANDPGKAPGTSSSSPNASDGRRTGVLPAPVTQRPSSSANRSDSTAQRTSGDDSKSRRDTPPSRTSDGGESRQRSSDRAPESGSQRARDTAKTTTGCATPNSFVPGTPVLLADGTYKPIEQVKIGDRVLATDPTGNLTLGRPVIALIPGNGLKKLVRITVDTDGDRGNATGTVTATDEHPFWEARTGRWTDAEDLDPNDLLRTPDGRLLEVVDVHEWAQPQQVHNLTVEGLHTYYVNVGGQDVLTHNDGGKKCDRGRLSPAQEWQPEASEVERPLPEGYRSSPALEGDPYHPDAVEERSRKNQARYGSTVADLAGDLGYGTRIPPQKARALFDSHGQAVFFNGKNYITPDVDGHNVVGWKMFDRSGRRIGTYDRDLNYVKK